MHDPRSTQHQQRLLHYSLLALTVVAILAVPLALRMVSAAVTRESVTPSYLPALEPSRERLPFREEPIGDLRYLQPGWVFIGDSILGTRVEFNTFGELNGMETVGVLFQPGTGPAWWYLAFKNWLVASGQKPKLTFIFFRDYQLTDTMFRLTDQYRWSLDQVARDTEPVLNNIVAARVQGPWSSLRSRVTRTYGSDRVRDVVEPVMKQWPTWLLASPDRRGAVLGAVNERFGLDRLRPMAAADATFLDQEQADFDAMLPSSVLPALVRLAKANQLRVCFVRAKRRPADDGTPPPQPEYLQRYVSELKAWVESQGMLFIDDTADPRLTLDMYEDGDHVKKGARLRYTQIFSEKVQALLK